MNKIEFPQEKKQKFYRMYFRYKNKDIDMDIIEELYNAFSFTIDERNGGGLKELFEMPYPFVISRNDKKCFASIHASDSLLEYCNGTEGFWRFFQLEYIPNLMTYMCKKHKHCVRYYLIDNYLKTAQIYIHGRGENGAYWYPTEIIK